MIGLDRQLDHRPVVLCCHLADALPQAVAYRPDKHRAPPLGAPDDVVHDTVYVVPFVRIVRVESILFFNTARKAERPFIPGLNARGFLASFLYSATPPRVWSR